MAQGLVDLPGGRWRCRSASALGTAAGARSGRGLIDGRLAVREFSTRGRFGLVYQGTGDNEGAGDHLRTVVAETLCTKMDYVRVGGDHLR